MPFPFISKLITTLQSLQSRINPDIYRGLLLETVQRAYSEQLERLLDYDASANKDTKNYKHAMEVLLLAHANIMFSRKDLLSKVVVA